MEIRRGRRLLTIALAALGGLTLAILAAGMLLVPVAIQKAREVRRREQAAENLRQLELALQNYHQVHAKGVAADLPGGSGGDSAGSEQTTPTVALPVEEAR